MVRKGPFDSQMQNLCVLRHHFLIYKIFGNDLYLQEKKIQNRCEMVSKSIKFDVKNDGCDIQVGWYLIYFAIKGKPFSCQNENHFDVKFPCHLIAK